MPLVFSRQRCLALMTLTRPVHRQIFVVFPDWVHGFVESESPNSEDVVP
jgi:hypothetical protein